MLAGESSVLLALVKDLEAFQLIVFRGLIWVCQGAVRAGFWFVLREFSWTGRVMEKVGCFSKAVDSFVRRAGGRRWCKGRHRHPVARDARLALQNVDSSDRIKEDQGPGKASMKGALTSPSRPNLQKWGHVALTSITPKWTVYPWEGTGLPSLAQTHAEHTELEVSLLNQERGRGKPLTA